MWHGKLFIFCLTCVVVQILNYSFRNLSSLGRTLPLEKRGKVGQGVKIAQHVCSSDEKSRQGPTRDSGPCLPHCRELVGRSELRLK